MECKVQQKKHMKIGLLGASFDTGNLGVSALAESSLKVILNRWPDADIILVGSGYEPQQHHLFLMEKEICVRTLPIRFSKNIFLPYHFLWFVCYGLVTKVLPRSRIKNVLVNRNVYFKELFETSLVMDITGGDSFSDIYGFRRFFLGFLLKWLVLRLGKKLILLPQTYGPFKRRITKIMARYIISRASVVYSRDQAGLGYVNKVLGCNTKNGKVRFVPDLAFVLDARKPNDLDSTLLSRTREKGTIVVGINISGLLFNGGFTQNNMFNLKTDYRDLIYRVIDLLMGYENTVILLISHVFPPEGLEIECDFSACHEVYESVCRKYEGRIFLVEGVYNHNEVKYIIGMCDFFIGSRMHACIAAMSKSILAVGLAYSKKFQGVFQAVGMQEFVIDLRQATEKEVLDRVKCAYDKRSSITRSLEKVIPCVQKSLLSIFEDMSLLSDLKSLA